MHTVFGRGMDADFEIDLIRAAGVFSATRWKTVRNSLEIFRSVAHPCAHTLRFIAARQPVNGPLPA